MAPVMQYVFAEMLVISEYFAAGSHEWLPYSKDEVCLKTVNSNFPFLHPKKSAGPESGLRMILYCFS